MHFQKLCSFFLIIMVVTVNGTWGRQWELVRGAAGAGDLTHMENKADSPEPGAMQTSEADSEPTTKTEKIENDLPIVLTLSEKPQNPEGKDTDPAVPSEALKAYEEASHNKQLDVTHMEQVEESKYVSTISKSADDIPKLAQIDDVKETGLAEEKEEDSVENTDEESSGEGFSEEASGDEGSGEDEISDETNSDEELEQVTETNEDEVPETTEVIEDEDYTEDEESLEVHTENAEPSEDHTEFSKYTDQNKSEEQEGFEELSKQIQEDDLHLLKSRSKRWIEEPLLVSDGELGSGEIPPLEGTPAKDESDDLNPGGAPAIPEDDDVSDEATDSWNTQFNKPRRVVQH